MLSRPSGRRSPCLPETQLHTIVESGEHRRIRIGSSPLAGNADIRVDPDRLFGRHLAILGNTGSGKSCSVAGLIRWSLDEARSASPQGGSARFLILDPNGEYSAAFASASTSFSTQVFTVNAAGGNQRLNVPLWFWNSAEWISFTQASPGAQAPLLKRALRAVKARHTESPPSAPDEGLLLLRTRLSAYSTMIQASFRSGEIKSDSTRFGYMLKSISEDLREMYKDSDEGLLPDLMDKADAALQATYNSFTDRNGVFVEHYRAFRDSSIRELIDCIEEALEELGGALPSPILGEDTPVPFKGKDLVDYMEVVSRQEGSTQYVEPLLTRMRTFLADPRMTDIFADDSEVSLEQWLNQYLGNGPCISIIDLSLVPTETIHIITAVIARMILEALQRHVKAVGKELPTVLVVEEAHTFIKRYQGDVESSDVATTCCQVFEKIAREGRKFGLGLALSSQRPSELSPTVLAQCNSFLLHRISNDRDQDLVHRLVPDNLRGLFRELPSLPSQTGILLGWATELPVLVRMRDLPEEQQPRSQDPDFWDVWTGTERPINWKTVSSDWTAGPDVVPQLDAVSPPGELPGPQLGQNRSPGH